MSSNSAAQPSNTATTMFIRQWKVTSAFQSPKPITVYENKPDGVMKTELSFGIWKQGGICQ